MKGKINSLYPARLWGEIETDQGEIVSFSARELDEPIKYVRAGQQVAFDVVKVKKRLVAQNISVEW